MEAASSSVLLVALPPQIVLGTCRHIQIQQKEYMKMCDGRLIELVGRPMFQEVRFEEIVSTPVSTGSMYL